MRINPSSKLVQLDPRQPQFYQDPYPFYDQLHVEAPIFFWENYERWSFIRHRDVSAILRDRRFGRQILHKMTRQELGLPPERPELKSFLDVDRHSLLDMEPPDHTRLRGLAQKAFMSRQIEQLQPKIAALSHRLIDGMAAKEEVDLLAEFATPIPVIIIAEMLGVPTEMCDQLLAWSHAMVAMYELSRSEEQERKAVQAAIDFVAYLRQHVESRRRQPGDDLLSKLIEIEEAGEKLTEDELISTAILLLNAGHEATVNVTGNGVVALLQNREQWERWRANPTLTTSAVEELLRYDTPLHLFNRWVLEDLEFGGQQLKRGMQVSLLLGAANRDPQTFEEASKLNVAREKNPHLSFGGGIHYCLGAPLARLELQTALPILLERAPDLQLAEMPAFRNSYHFRGVGSLRVRL